MLSTSRICFAIVLTVVASLSVASEENVPAPQTQLLVAAMSEPSTPAADDNFAFEFCNETQRHISLARQDDHMIVHFHVRIKNQAGQTIYVRQRTANSQQGLDGDVTSTYRKTLSGQDELFSVYMRFPIFSDANEQNAVLYQTEVGIYDGREFNDYGASKLTFAWKIKRSSNGNYEAIASDQPLPLEIRQYQITGSSLSISKAHAAGRTADNISFGFGNIDVRNIDGERRMRKIN